MIKQEFLGSLTNYTSNTEQQLTMWSEILKNYSEPNRHYHNLAHLNSILTELKIHQDKFSNWDAIVFAIVYHDFVYDASKSNNEEQSAAIALQRLKQIVAPEHLTTFCEHLILATKNHESSDMETNLFTDADLSILGSDSETYTLYSKQIRREYSVFPDLVYNPERKKVLTHFLNMTNIYKTKEFSDKYELRARANLHAELNALQS
jgi:predicted metal-dependent HD superfamily phosphohydrolase